jgi:hypothetical protein
MEVCRIFIKINKLFKNYLLYLATSSSTQWTRTRSEG